MNRLVILAIFCAGCAVHPGGLEEAKDRIINKSAMILPGQNVTLRLESGETRVVMAGESYVSALGETCVQIPGAVPGVACLRNGEWSLLRDIFLPHPGQGALP